MILISRQQLKAIERRVEDLERRFERSDDQVAILSQHFIYNVADQLEDLASPGSEAAPLRQESVMGAIFLCSAERARGALPEALTSACDTITDYAESQAGLTKEGS
ncbi:hypothetical protein HYH03_005582 [Edaphochlamys debaryana]|uniref:Uncharacterized protein n=1 Tax=Edaphochlamys debaryana TaxID=47281 RepID=A0A835Y4P3_9CHLO|nr:hypothetical protein HYH03_005582 [Edaphochlamys debaryana]|eukprot:KAG2496352.1 hypothetical protein HYH03_005582 [Edaphochlamys debaryana]